MLYAYVERFDVMDGRENILGLHGKWQLNMASVSLVLTPPASHLIGGARVLASVKTKAACTNVKGHLPLSMSVSASRWPTCYC
jgi:hypothetical protein